MAAIDDYLVRTVPQQGLLTLSSPTTDIGPGAAGSVTATIALGWTFTLLGVDYTTIYARGLGLVRFDAGGSFGQNDLIGTNAYILAAPWADFLRTAETDGYMKHELQGSAPYRRLVVEWRCRHNAETASDHYVATFQAVFYETTNRIEFRYAALETVGSPGLAWSASVGAKDDNTSTATDIRNFDATGHRLGGSDSTWSPVANIDAWPDVDYIFEPNFPVRPVYELVRDQDLAGPISADAEPLPTIGANLNWLYAAGHRPPVSNMSPYGSEDSVQRFVDPVVPSADNLTYEVYIGTYTTTGGDLVVDIDREAAADPQPNTNADWENLATFNRAAEPATTYSWWSVGEVALPAGMTLMRVVASATFPDTVKLLSCVLLPKALDAVGPDPYLSGFVPFGLGQLLQYGGAMHPELLNRLRMSRNRIMLDRRQVAFAFNQSSGTDIRPGVSAVKQVRGLGVTPTVLRGQAGATIAVKVGAYDTTDGGKIVVGERGGDAVSFTVDKNGDEYRHQEAELTLQSDEATIYIDLSPAGTLRPLYVKGEWTPGA